MYSNLLKYCSAMMDKDIIGVIIVGVEAVAVVVIVTCPSTLLQALR